MKHFGWARRRLARSLRVRFGVFVLACMLLPAIFAELVAADAPIVAVGRSGVVLLPAIVPPAAQRGMSHEQLAALYRDDVAIWPLVRFGPDSVSDAGGNAPMSWRHPLGTDVSGRDVLARLTHGGRAALGLALLALALAVSFGVLFGLAAGWLGGFWDETLSRAAELVEAFPAVVVVALIRAIDPERGTWSLLFALAAVRWAEVARLVRAEVIRLSSADFVLAARALGCPRGRIARRHVLPHAIGPVLVSAMFGLVSLVVLEVAVSFLGLGQRGSWGAMIAEGQGGGPPFGSATAAWWAGGAVALTLLSAYLLADALREALDARLAARHPVSTGPFSKRARVG